MGTDINELRKLHRHSESVPLPKSLKISGFILLLLLVVVSAIRSISAIQRLF